MLALQRLKPHQNQQCLIPVPTTTTCRSCSHHQQPLTMPSQAQTSPDAAAAVHLVSKQDISQHTVLPISPSRLPPLAPCSVRAKPALLSLTLHNRSLAQLGHVLNTWDAFPLPADLPAPYNDPERWGVLPCFGFAKVVESEDKDGDLPGVGTLLFGLWPASSLPVDLLLRQPQCAGAAPTPGHFLDCSPHRGRLVTTYNRYQVVDPARHPEPLRAWHANALTAWGAGWLMSRYTFAAAEDGASLIGPTGEGYWSDRDADLCSAVVVVLGASSRAARGFSWALSRRDKAATGPLALLEVTSSPDDLEHQQQQQQRSGTATAVVGPEVRVMGYGEAPRWKHAEKFICHRFPNRVVLVDFGSPEGVAQSFHDVIMASAASPSTLTYVRVGAGSTSFATADPRTRTHFLNNGPLMEAAIRCEGLEAVYEARLAAFRQWLDEKANGKMDIRWGDGIGGADGMEGAWEKITQDNYPRQAALVFRV